MLFICDLDGTLLDDSHDIDDVVISGIQEVLAKGHYFVICTGRCMYGSGTVNFGIEHEHMYTIAMNGALVYDGSANIISSSPIDKEIIRTFCHDLDDILVRYEGKDNSFCTFTSENANVYLDESSIFKGVSPCLRRMFFFNEYDYFGSKTHDILTNDIYKIEVVLADSNSKERADAILARHRDKVVNAPWDIGICDITNAEINKGVVAKSLAEKLGFEDKDIYVYGDSNNDLEMLEMFSNSACPCNANDAAKAVAKRIIGDNDDHSVIKDILTKI